MVLKMAAADVFFSESIVQAARRDVYIERARESDQQQPIWQQTAVVVGGKPGGERGGECRHDDTMLMVGFER